MPMSTRLIFIWFGTAVEHPISWGLYSFQIADTIRILGNKAALDAGIVYQFVLFVIENETWGAFFVKFYFLKGRLLIWITLW